MANERISEFNHNHNPNGDNLIPIVASGETMTIDLSGLTEYITSDFSSGKKHIRFGDEVTVKEDTQFLVYGDLLLEGTLNNNGNITILNGSFINSGGTYTTSGGTMDMIKLNRDSTRLQQIDGVAQSGATIDFATYTTRTHIKVNTELTGDTFFTCSNKTNSIIGDVLSIFTTIGTGSSITYSFDNSFILSTCGGISSPSHFDADGPRNVVTFIFDGDYWVSTWDNC